MVDAALIVKDVEEPLPDDGALPEPVQPVQTYCTPEVPAVGDVTDAEITDPESNQPLTGLGESYAEVTVR